MKCLSMRSYTTLTLCLTVFFLFADQNLLAPNLSAIAKEFNYNDHQRDELLGGYIAFGFFIVGGPVALLVGYFTDTVNRCMLFGLVVTFGESACFATYWVKNYSELFACRVLTGISIGGATPIIFSLLGDLYPGSSRIYVSTLVGIASGAGVSAGQFISGMIGPVLGWRAPFLMIASPAIVCGLLVFFTVDEPSRGDQEQAVLSFRERRTASLTYQCDAPESSSSISRLDFAAGKPSYTIRSTIHSGLELDLSLHDESVIAAEEDHYTEKIDCSKVLQLLQTASVLLIFLQGMPGCLPWGMIIVFLNDYFSNDRGMTVQQATGAMTCFGIGGLFGQLFGGWFGQRLYNRSPPYQCILMGSSTILSVPPMLYLLNNGQVGDLGFYFMATFSGFLVNMNGPNVRVVLQNVCFPEIRGTAFAFFTLTDDIGKGLGPALVVLLIEACGGQRREAFNIVVMFWIFCGFMLLSLSFTVVQDERRVQEKIKESLLRKAQESLADEEPRNMLASPSRADTSYVEILDENIDSVLAHPVDSTPTAFGIPTRSEGYKRNPLFSIEHTHIIEYGLKEEVPVRGVFQHHANTTTSYSSRMAADDDLSTYNPIQPPHHK